MANYSMYTGFGNDAVDAIVRSAKVLKMEWPQVLQELRSLADRFPEDFGEATDTAVRECVYNKLGFDTPFYISTEHEMDQDTKADISKIQQAIWKLEQAVELLNQVDGMDRYCDTMCIEIDALTQEMAELHSIG
jgi:hypothetical protein